MGLYLFLSLRVLIRPRMESLSILRKGGVTTTRLGAGRLLKCWRIWDSTSVNSGAFLCQGTLLWIRANFRGDGMRK